MEHGLDTSKNISARRGVFCRCGLLCSTPTSLEAHIKTFNLPRKFQCKLCEESFVAGKFLRGHMERKHQVKAIFREAPNGPVACGDCGEKFATIVDHRIHRASFHEKIDVNTYEKDSIKNVKLSAVLLSKPGKLHGMASSDPATCKCGTTYTDTRALALHMRSQLKQLKCHVCGKRFGYLTSLKSHVETAHQIFRNRQVFMCKRCDAPAFSTLENIAAHCAEKHGDD